MEKYSFVFLISLLSSLTDGWAKTASLTSIRTTLLGQPCSLQGPFDAETLKKIHSIGPAQLPIPSPLDLNQSKKEAKEALEKIKKVSSLPSSLKDYHEQVKNKLELEISFLNAFQNHRESELNPFGQTYLKGTALENYKSLIKKLGSLDRHSSVYRETAVEIFDIFNDGMNDSDKLFHRATKQLGVEYNCTFDPEEE